VRDPDLLSTAWVREIVRPRANDFEGYPLTMRIWNDVEGA
jgi:hypothetical protein